MSITKEITIGLLVIGLVSIAFLGIAQEYSSKLRLSGSEVENARENSVGPSGLALENVRENSAGQGASEAENVQENSVSQPSASWWDNHDLHAVPGLENASVEDLPTAEEVENILFNWPVFENARLSPFIDWNGSYEDVLNILKDYDFEYHFDENDELVIDTPSVHYKKPEEPLPEDSYALPVDNNTYRIWNYTEVRNALDFSRYLDNLKVQNGIVIFHMSNLLPEAKTVIPVQEGLAYYVCDNKGWSHWSGIWHTLNPKPSDMNPFYTKKCPLVKIEIHWRLGEGEYVSWLYELENGEPVMTWLDNGEPVDW